MSGVEVGAAMEHLEFNLRVLLPEFLEANQALPVGCTVLRAGKEGQPPVTRAHGAGRVLDALAVVHAKAWGVGGHRGAVDEYQWMQGRCQLFKFGIAHSGCAEHHSIAAATGFSGEDCFLAGYLG